MHDEMKNLLFLLAAMALLLPGCGRKTAAEGDSPLPVIFETDLGNDVDDALALDLLYKYQDAGKIRLLAVNLNKNGEAPAEFADIMNTWYGYPDIPIGIIRDGAECESDAAVNYAKAVVELKDAEGSPSSPVPIRVMRTIPRLSRSIASCWRLSRITRSSSPPSDSPPT